MWWTKSQDSVHKSQPLFFWRERRAEAVSNRGPSAYQPNALPLGQTGSTSQCEHILLYKDAGHLHRRRTRKPNCTSSHFVPCTFWASLDLPDAMRNLHSVIIYGSILSWNKIYMHILCWNKTPLNRQQQSHGISNSAVSHYNSTLDYKDSSFQSASRGSTSTTDNRLQYGIHVMK